VRLVVRQSAALAVGGLLVGVPLAWGASRLLRGLLLGMAGGVALPLLGAALVLGLAAATASWVPARRAANVDAVRALRSD
jgi:ABC-type antimicrobial peptide transport system permease subunit